MNADAYLCAMTFDEEAELINYARYGKDTGFYCVNSIKRHPDGNILFAGCNGYVAVILWAQDQFHLINSIPNVINSPVTDMSFSKDTLYVVSDHDKGMVIYFDDHYLKRDPAGPEPDHGRYRNLDKNPNKMSLAD
jgi:WD40 repeat protein